MSAFSLEDDDCKSLFITQSSVKSDESVNNVGILPDPLDFSSPCESLVSRGNISESKYSDISDDDFEIPPSQNSMDTSSKCDANVTTSKTDASETKRIGISCIMGLNVRKWNGLKVCPTTSTVSKRKFNYASEECIANLKQIKLKKKSEAKIDWAVSAYIDWRSDRLERFQYDPAIYFADLTQLDTLQKDNLNHALCRFIPKVTKKRGEGEYPGDTLYQMIVAIQRFLVVNKVKWHLLDDLEFDDMRTVLDNVMRERTAKNIGVVKKQAGLITFEHEESLWDQGVLGEDTPDKLRNTVLFLLGINAHLCAVEEHYYLRRDTPEEKGQLSFMSNPRGVRGVVYQEDSITKTHDGGLKNMKHDRKTVWIYPNLGNCNRCPVRLIEKYLSLCPAYYRKANFYLKSLQKPGPKQWYCEQVVGQNIISKVVQTLMKDAKIEGYFTNHSARCTGGTRLFRAGVDRKLVKEATGHTSDAVDKYQITSDEQCAMMSRIIAGNQIHVSENCENECPKADKSIMNTVSLDQEGTVSNVAQTSTSVETSSVGGMINEIIEKTYYIW